MSTPDSPAARINTALGGAVATDGAEALAAAAVGGLTPRAVAFPRTEEQVAALLALAGREHWAVVPWGGASSRAGAAPPARYDVALSLSALAGVPDHDADNLTLTAQAGLPLAEACRLVRPKRQFLPLGFAHERRTLGGLVAANRTPPQRLQYGDVRDQLLGLRVATASGALVRYGRKVLKNVAGYDMNKLFLGSEGLLGVIVEVTLKLAALPDESGCLLGAFPGASQAFACAGALFRSCLEPSGIFVLDGAAGSALRAAQGLTPVPDMTHVLVGFEGRSATVKRQLRDGAAIMSAQGAAAVETAPALSEQAAALLERPPVRRPGAPVMLRLGVTPTALPEMWNSLAEHLATQGAEAKVADYGAGRLLAALPEPDAPERWAEQVEALRARLARQRGYVVLHSAPPALHAHVPAWGAMDGERCLLKAFKARLDPQGILSPGRFIA
jgi:glycolate oxidase FAD binding subunit